MAVKITIDAFEMSMERTISVPEEKVSLLVDYIIRNRRYGVKLSFRSPSSSIDDSFEFSYSGPSSMCVGGGLPETIERTRDLISYLEELQKALDSQ